MSAQKKYHVTIEDCEDQDDIPQRQNTDRSPFDIDPIGNARRTGGPSDSQSMSWDEVNELEAKARKEREQDTMERQNAEKTAHIIDEYYNKKQS